MQAELERDSGQNLGAKPSTPQRSPGRPAFLFLGAGLGLALIYLLLPRAFQNLAQDAAGAATVVAIAFGVRRNKPANPLPWYLFALGQALFVVGDSIWTYYEDVLHVESPFPSVADAAYLLGYLPLTIGLVLIVRARRPGRDAASLIDAAIVAVAFGIGSWIFLIAPTIEPGLSVSEVVVSAAYPLVDVLLIAVAAALAFGTDLRAFSYRLIAASLAALIIADTLYSFGTIGDWYDTGNPLDIGWIAAYVFWGAAALHPSMRTLTEAGAQDETARFTRRRLAVYGLAVLAIPGMRIFLTFQGGTSQGTVIAVGAALASLLVLARMAGLLSALEAAALRDALTGLPNRRLLLDRIGQAFRRAERSGSPVAMLFLDLGGFKGVNDRYGHEAGDHVLVEVGRRIESAVRRTDTVARLGGDEFVVVCEGLDRIQAEMLAHRVRQSVVKPIAVRREMIDLSVDLGIAVENAPADADVAELLRAADRAMYHAKAAAKESGSGSPLSD